MISFVTEHRQAVAILATLWFAFVLMRLLQTAFFSGGDGPLLLTLLSALYVFVPWFLFSVGLGWWVNSIAWRSNQKIIMLTAVGCIFALIHICIMTTSYWIFWPASVSKVTVGFVFTEQFLKWYLFELIFFALCVVFWRYRVQQPPDPEPDSLFLSTQAGHKRFDRDDVIWIQADDNYVNVHTLSGTYRIRSTLRDTIKRLDTASIVQTHRSAAVNTHHIEHIGKNRVALTNGDRAPVSRRRQGQLLERLALTGSNSSDPV